MNSTLAIGITGIVVSGIVGPAIAAWFSQRSQVNNFNRVQAAERRDALRIVLDQAATLLATGVTNLRILRENKDDLGRIQSAQEWLSQVFPIGQRLQLWLAYNDPVVVAYETVRSVLVVMTSSGTEHETEQLMEQFELDRRLFLDLARTRLLEPISAKDGAS